MERMITRMIQRMVMRFLMRSAKKGVMTAARKGAKAWEGRQSRKTAAQPQDIEQDPAVTGRRKRHEDERKGDEILYPVDEFTEDMQPRR
ncbi:MAG: hypothetical protein AAF401_17190 [Pseudomonadota bacterium]